MWPPGAAGTGCLPPALMWFLLAPCRVPTVPVKNLTGSSPVNPALAGEDGAAAGCLVPMGAGLLGGGGGLALAGCFLGEHLGFGVTLVPQCHFEPPCPGITGILMSAAGLPVCLTRPPKLVLHPPPVSKSEIQSIPGISHTCRKTTKKQAKKGERHFATWPLFLSPPASRPGSPVPPVSSCCPQQWVSPVLPSSPSDSSSPAGKTPEEVLKKYLQKVRHPLDEV